MHDGGRTRVGIVGAGDVAHRHYLPALEAMGDRVEIAWIADPRPGAADAAAATVRTWSPNVTGLERLEQALDSAPVDLAINLTPAPLHATTSRACLEAGSNLYSEKPLASTLGDADALIELAASRERQLLCAPGVAVTERFRWLAAEIAAGVLGPVTLAVTHHADTGPATWREYTGDPTVFYQPGVGPLIDHGVYRLHGLTFLLGPVRRVQAMGAISTPTRLVRGGPLTGRTIPVTTPDHVLLNLEFASGALGQVLASFGAPSTLAPWLELHFARGTISMSGASWDKDAPTSRYLEDDGPLGPEGWQHDIAVPPDDAAVVEAGVRHAIEVVRGEARPVLTAEHARHVLDIIVKAYASIEDGRLHDTETTF